MTISKDRVKPSPLPDSWKLKEIFSIGVVLGTYMALMTVLFFYLMHSTTFFSVNETFLALYFDLPKSVYGVYVNLSISVIRARF